MQIVTTKKYLRFIRYNFWGVIIVQVFLLCIIMLRNSINQSLIGERMSDIIEYLIPALSGCFFIAFIFFFDRKVTQLKKLSELNHKLLDYRTIIISYYTLIVGLNLINFLALMLSGLFSVLISCIALIVFQLIKFPTKNRIAFHLQLKNSQRHLFDNPDTELFVE